MTPPHDAVPCGIHADRASNKEETSQSSRASRWCLIIRPQLRSPLTKANDGARRTRGSDSLAAVPALDHRYEAAHEVGQRGASPACVACTTIHGTGCKA